MSVLLHGGRTTMITRAEWGARRPDYVTRFTPSFGSTAHWEGPAMPDFHHGACASYVRGIQNFHMNARGWSDIAYTAVVCPHGYVFEGRWIGHRTGANGTNAGNGTAYAICFLGGQGDPYTPAADRAMHDTVTHLRRHGRAGPGVNCHRDWKPTECPGNVICGRVRSGAYSTDYDPQPGPGPGPDPGEDEDMIEIVWYVGEPTDPGDQPDAWAAYRVISSRGSDGKWWGHTAIHVQDEAALGLLRYVKHPEKRDEPGAQDQPLQVKDWRAGMAFVNGPFHNV